MDDRDELWRLLSEGLDLCARARNMDAMDRRAGLLEASDDPEGWEKSGGLDRFIERNNAARPESYIHTKSATVHLWVQEQYDKDLAEWEAKARRHLTQHPL